MTLLICTCITRAAKRILTTTSVLKPAVYTNVRCKTTQWWRASSHVSFVDCYEMLKFFILARALTKKNHPTQPGPHGSTYYYYITAFARLPSTDDRLSSGVFAIKTPHQPPGRAHVCFQNTSTQGFARFSTSPPWFDPRAAAAHRVVCSSSRSVVNNVPIMTSLHHNDKTCRRAEYLSAAIWIRQNSMGTFRVHTPCADPCGCNYKCKCAYRR